MATNPQSPFSQKPDKGPRLAPKLPIVEKSRFPWPVLAIVAAGVILAALIYWLPRTPKTEAPPTAAEVPPQPTGAQIQFTNLKIQPAPVGTSMYLTGVLHNEGNTVITGIQVQADFHGANGQTLETQKRPVEALADSNGTTAVDLTKQPIRPNQDQPFRVYFEHYPPGWNKQVPALTISAVTATTGNPVPPNPGTP